STPSYNPFLRWYRTSFMVKAIFLHIFEMNSVPIKILSPYKKNSWGRS
ncbi:14529_t:CDS:1, partial [Funneliformis caledonium]